MNLNNDLIAMIVIAWEQGVRGATMCVVDRADACGFDMRCLDASGRAPRNFALVYAGPPKRTLGDDAAPLSSLGPGPVALMVADLDA